MTITMVGQTGSRHKHSDVPGVSHVAHFMKSLGINLARRGGVPLKRDGEIKR